MFMFIRNQDFIMFRNDAENVFRQWILFDAVVVQLSLFMTRKEITNLTLKSISNAQIFIFSAVLFSAYILVYKVPIPKSWKWVYFSVLKHDQYSLVYSKLLYSSTRPSMDFHFYFRHINSVKIKVLKEVILFLNFPHRFRT